LAVLAVTVRATLAPSTAARLRDVPDAVVSGFTGAVVADAAAVRDAVPGAWERGRRVPGVGAA
jgi:hypothetical protein